jgi:Tol biopolymer transport system component
MKRLVFLLKIILISTLISGYAQAQQSEDKIVFTSDRDGNREIYIMDMDGSNLKRLTETPGTERFPDWSPDGSKIVFLTNRDGNYEVYIMDKDGSNQTRLTNTPEDEFIYPAFSPDGSKIAFNSWRIGLPNIYIMDSDGNNQERLTNINDQDRAPSWSPDGKEIIFSSNMGGKMGIYAINIADSAVRKIINTSGDDKEPRFSPDGEFIVFPSDWEQYNSEIYVINADGTNLTRLTFSPEGGHTFSPRWTADGSQIVFESYGGISEKSEVYIMNTDGSNQVNLTNHPAGDYDPDVLQVGIISSVEDSHTPDKFILSQNSPNPFNPSTTIEYAIPVGISGQVCIGVYDLRGALVRTLVNEFRGSGVHSVVWDGVDNKGDAVSSGIYIYRLQIGEYIKSNRMTLVR